MAEGTKKRSYTRKTNNETKTDETTSPVTEIPEESGVVNAPTVEEAPRQPEPAPTPVQMVVEQKAPPVKILYIDSCIPNNQIPIAPGRYITGSGRIFAVALEQFEGEFMTPLVMKLIDNRKFIVLSGLSDEQRHQYNCYYDEGEVVRDEGLFDHLFSIPAEQAAGIFSALCPEHQRMVATRFISAYFERHDNRITRDKVEALNKASKATDPEGLFTPIVKDINDKV
jgi:hypothetical protein